MELREVPMGGAEGPDEVELWLLFRCRNSQVGPKEIVCRDGPANPAGGSGGSTNSATRAAELLLGQICEAAT